MISLQWSSRAMNPCTSVNGFSNWKQKYNNPTFYVLSFTLLHCFSLPLFLMHAIPSASLHAICASLNTPPPPVALSCHIRAVQPILDGMLPPFTSARCLWSHLHRPCNCLDLSLTVSTPGAILEHRFHGHHLSIPLGSFRGYTLQRCANIFLFNAYITDYDNFGVTLHFLTRSLTRI